MTEPTGRAQTIFSPMFEDFDATDRENENRWFDDEHVPMRLSLPGFLSAERYELWPSSGYQGTGSPLRYVNFYFIDGPQAVQTDAYRAQASHPTRRITRKRIGVSLREVWDEKTRFLDRARELTVTTGPKCMLLRTLETSSPAGTDDAFETPRDAALFLSAPGVIGFQRFVRNDEIEDARPRQHRAARLLDIFWLTSPETATSPSFSAVVDTIATLEHDREPATVVQWEGIYVQRPSPWALEPRYG
jgi:hypothetical protein